jgi:hypothetical protein
MLRRNSVSSETSFRDESVLVHNSTEILDFPIAESPSSCLSEIGIRDDPLNTHRLPSWLVVIIM